MKANTLQELIETLFSKWTYGLNTKESRVSIFRKIRDIPFEVIPQTSLDYEKSLEIILIEKRGSCSSKHFLLGKMFEKLNIPIEYPVYTFYWEDLDILYPSELKELVIKLPEQYHLACRAYIEGRYVLIDATWDLPLKKVNFPVNEKWDGISDMKIAVNPIEEFICKTPEERKDYLLTKIKNEKNDSIYKFYKELNKWLNKVRNEK